MTQGAPWTSNMMAGQLIGQITQILAYGRLPLSQITGVYHRVHVMIHDSSTQLIHNFPKFQTCIGTAHGCDDDICFAVFLSKHFTLDIFHDYSTHVQNVKVFDDLGLIGQNVIQLLIACNVCHLGHVAELSKLSIKGKLHAYSSTYSCFCFKVHTLSRYPLAWVLMQRNMLMYLVKSPPLLVLLSICSLEGQCST